MAGLSQTWAQLTNLCPGRLASHPPANLTSKFFEPLLRSERGSRNAPALFQTKSHGHAQGHSGKDTRVIGQGYEFKEAVSWDDQPQATVFNLSDRPIHLMPLKALLGWEWGVACPTFWNPTGPNLMQNSAPQGLSGKVLHKLSLTFFWLVLCSSQAQELTQDTAIHLQPPASRRCISAKPGS